MPREPPTYANSSGLPAFQEDRAHLRQLRSGHTSVGNRSVNKYVTAHPVFGIQLYDQAHGGGVAVVIVNRRQYKDTVRTHGSHALSNGFLDYKGQLVKADGDNYERNNQRLWEVSARKDWFVAVFVAPAPKVLVFWGRARRRGDAATSLPRWNRADAPLSYEALVREAPRLKRATNSQTKENHVAMVAKVRAHDQVYFPLEVHRMTGVPTQDADTESDDEVVDDDDATEAPSPGEALVGTA